MRDKKMRHDIAEVDNSNSRYCIVIYRGGDSTDVKSESHVGITSYGVQYGKFRPVYLMLVCRLNCNLLINMRCGIGVHSSECRLIKSTAK